MRTRDMLELVHNNRSIRWAVSVALLALAARCVWGVWTRRESERAADSVGADDSCSVDIGRLPEREAQAAALDELSGLLKSHPHASVLTVIWLHRGQNRREPRSAMSYNRTSGLLCIEHGDGCERAAPMDEASVHRLAATGGINGFGASNWGLEHMYARD